MPGPPKKPTALKLLQGNPGKRPLPKNEPKAPVCAPAPPGELSAQARKHWDRIVCQLAESGIMTALDSDALAAYCEAYSRWLQANERLLSEGCVMPDEKGFPRHSPWLRIANDSFQQMRSLLQEFGLSPASRAKIQVAKQEDENPFAAIDRMKNKSP